jgi:APA family basic amino acid/polyamine antiporter
MTETSAAVPQRALGFWMATALVIGNTIGMGIFTLPAAIAPFGLNALAGWIVTLIGFLFIAKVLSGLARAFPADDGPYAYTHRAFGEGTAFIVLWCYWVATWITNAAIAIAVVGYLATLLPVINTVSWLPPVIALGLVWFFVLLNLRGVRIVGSAQIITVILKLLPMAAVIMLGIWQLVVEPAAYTANPPPTPFELQKVIDASTLVIFAMLGVECASIPAGKVMDPERTIPRATMIGTVLVALIYIAVSTIPMLLIPQEQLATSNAPFADLMAQYLGPASGQLLAIFVIISGLGALNGWTLVVGEVTENFAKRGSFPRPLAKLNSHGAPQRALFLTGTVASLMLVLNYNQSMVGAFKFLTVVVTAANLPLYLFSGLAVLVLWRRGQLTRFAGRERSLLIAAAFSIAYCLWAFRGVNAKELLVAASYAAGGLVVYGGSLFLRRRNQAAPSSAV